MGALGKSVKSLPTVQRVWITGESYHLETILLTHIRPKLREWISGMLSMVRAQGTPQIVMYGSSTSTWGSLESRLMQITRLPNAPDIEIYSMYGVGIPTERAYVYKVAPTSDCYIPFPIDTSLSGDNEESCVKDGVLSVDGDETVPVLSASFMCGKDWRGKTLANPFGKLTYVREYDHAPPANLLEDQGTQSGVHVYILGKFALIEDVIRVAAGATGDDLCGDRVYSNIFKWSEKTRLEL